MSQFRAYFFRKAEHELCTKKSPADAGLVEELDICSFDLTIPVRCFCDAPVIRYAVTARSILGDDVKDMGRGIGSAAATPAMVFLAASGCINCVVSIRMIRGFLPFYGKKDGTDDNIVGDGRNGSDLRIPDIDAIQKTVHSQLTFEGLKLIFQSMIGCGFHLSGQERGKEEDKRNTQNGGNQVGIRLGFADRFFHLNSHYGFHIGLACGVA